MWKFNVFQNIFEMRKFYKNIFKISNFKENFQKMPNFYKNFKTKLLMFWTTNFLKKSNIIFSKFWAISCFSVDLAAYGNMRNMSRKSLRMTFRSGILLLTTTSSPKCHTEKVWELNSQRFTTQPFSVGVSPFRQKISTRYDSAAGLDHENRMMLAFFFLRNDATFFSEHRI